MSETHVIAEAENTNEHNHNVISDEWNVCIYDSVWCRTVLFCVKFVYSN